MEREKFLLNQIDHHLKLIFNLNYKNTIIGNQRNTINFETDDLDDVIQIKNLLFV